MAKLLEFKPTNQISLAKGPAKILTFKVKEASEVPYDPNTVLFELLWSYEG